MKIEKMRWYKIFVDGKQHIVRVDDRIMKYCVIDYFDGKLWFTGSCAKCKLWVSNHLDGDSYPYLYNMKVRAEK